jgi:hypothetical protein
MVEQSIRYTINDVPQQNSPLEAWRDQTIAIVALIFQDIKT